MHGEACAESALRDWLQRLSSWIPMLAKSRNEHLFQRVNTASEMTSIVSSGALNSTPTSVRAHLQWNKINAEKSHLFYFMSDVYIVDHINLSACRPLSFIVSFSAACLSNVSLGKSYVVLHVSAFDQWDRLPRSRIDVRPTALPLANLTQHITFTFNPSVQLRLWPIHMHRIDVKGQLVQKLERKQTNGRTVGHDRLQYSAR